MEESGCIFLDRLGYIGHHFLKELLGQKSRGREWHCIQSQMFLGQLNGFLAL
jgi:hypothetical protein